MTPRARALRLLPLPAVLLLLAFAARADPAAAPLRLEGGAVALRGPGFSARLSRTAEGALRVTALAEGAQPEALPFSIELPPGPALAATKGGFSGGSFSLAATEGGVSVSAGGRPLLRLSFERDGGGLRAALAVEGAHAFHGFGQIAPALALKSEKLELYHQPKFGDQTYLYIPFFFSDTGAAVYLNAAGKDRIELARGAEAALASASGRLDFYLWSEPDPAALVSRFYKLSGSRSLLPRWAYSYVQSKYGYRNDAEVRRAVSAFARFGLPLGAVVLDLYWFKRMGDLDWNREAFPDPQGLAAWLGQQGVKLVAISEPFFTKDSKQYAALEARGGLARDAQGRTVTWTDWWDFDKGTGGGVVDPESPAAAALLAERYAQLAREGIDGFWIDLGEPERVPAEARFGRWSEAGYHDFFNLAWARIVRGAIEKAAPGRRPFLLSRSGFTGIAGLGVATWSGDVPSSWEGLRDQLPLGLSASLSGLPFWGSDVGGFITEGGDLLPPDPELYLRWQQFGAFTPVDRAHGFGPREPWIYGGEWLRRVKAAIALRAKLLPYVYSTAYQVWTEGLPMMRPLFFLDPADPRLREEDGEYLFGDSILVAPVTRPLAREAAKKVLLPKGGWTDAATGARTEGPAEVELKLALETLPHWFRDGAIVPFDEGGEGLLLVPGPAETRFTVFSDDGETEAYRKGAGEKLEVVLSRAAVSISGAQRARALELRFFKDTPLGPLEARAESSGALYRTVKVELAPGRNRFALRQ